MSRISELRSQMGITMKEAAQQLDMPYTTYVNYEKGTREPNSETLIKLSKFFGTTIDDLLGSGNIPSGFSPLPEMKAIPLVGDIACGTPITAEENIIARVGVPAAWRADFALTCHGDSMAPKIQDGDIVCIRKQPTVENGEVAVVRIDGEATLKHFYRTGDTVTLMPDNPTACAPLVYSGIEINQLVIEGKAVGICAAEEFCPYAE